MRTLYRSVVKLYVYSVIMHPYQTTDALVYSSVADESYKLCWLQLCEFALFMSKLSALESTAIIANSTVIAAIQDTLASNMHMRLHI